MSRIGIVIFPEVEELDFVGPYEVFASLAQQLHTDELVLVAERAEPIRCAKGLTVVPERTLEAAGPLDVLVVPGGRGARRGADNARLAAWIAEVAVRARWVASVCTGAILLHQAGLLEGRRATTHWAFTEELRSKGVAVVEDARFVRDGKLVTAAGVSAGIDMALWLTGQLHDRAVARAVQRAIEYYPAPPYAADTADAA
jgi:transcriptional regulator GlxA family with amidase domain